ncbi:MAG: hypothetical protein MJ071_05170 [Oscillospiraceae bacterium]|nr:hypothetical protein [Oscillospiraceae bacterium]
MAGNKVKNILIHPLSSFMQNSFLLFLLSHKNIDSSSIPLENKAFAQIQFESAKNSQENNKEENALQCRCTVKMEHIAAACPVQFRRNVVNVPQFCLCNL